MYGWGRKIIATKPTTTTESNHEPTNPVRIVNERGKKQQTLYFGKALENVSKNESRQPTTNAREMKQKKTTIDTYTLAVFRFDKELLTGEKLKNFVWSFSIQSNVTGILDNKWLTKTILI